MSGRSVPASALEERERELLDAVTRSGVSAEELFGDATELAADDVTQLATTEEAVLTSEGAGLRPALIEVGGTMLAAGVVGAVMVALRTNGPVDVRVAASLVAAGVLVAFLGWGVSRAALSGGRSAATVGWLVAAAVLGVGCVAAAVRVGREPVLVHDVAVPLLAIALVAPGIIALLGASRLRRPELRDSWEDGEWFKRFRGGLRAGLVPADTARAHVAEIKQALGSAGSSAYDEFGHPLVLAREMAQADRAARTRRWWVAMILGAGALLVISALMLVFDSWGVLTIPVAVVFALGALARVAVGWDERPWQVS